MVEPIRAYSPRPITCCASFRLRRMSDGQERNFDVADNAGMIEWAGTTTVYVVSTTLHDQTGNAYGMTFDEGKFRRLRHSAP